MCHVHVYWIVFVFVWMDGMAGMDRTLVHGPRSIRQLFIVTLIIAKSRWSRLAQQQPKPKLHGITFSERDPNVEKNEVKTSKKTSRTWKWKKRIASYHRIDNELILNETSCRFSNEVRINECDIWNRRHAWVCQFFMFHQSFDAFPHFIRWLSTDYVVNSI